MTIPDIDQAKWLHRITAVGVVGFILLAFAYDSFAGLVSTLVAVLSCVSCATYGLKQEPV